VIAQTSFENNTNIAGALITSERSLLLDECIIKRNSLPIVTFRTTTTATISNSLVEDGVFVGGNLRVINSSVNNSQFTLANFVSQNSTITSSSILNHGKTTINVSQLIDSYHEWNGRNHQGIISNTTVRNTSIVVNGRMMTFSNSQFYPTKVSTLHSLLK